MGIGLSELEQQVSTLNKNWNIEDKLTIPLNIDIGIEPVVDYTEMGGRPAQFFIADDTYDVYSIKAVHNKVQTSADGAAISIYKVDSTTDPANATLNLITDTAFDGNDATFLGFNLKGIAINTVTDCTLTTTGSSLRLIAGDRLVYGCRGTISSVQVTLVTTLKRIRA